MGNFFKSFDIRRPGNLPLRRELVASPNLKSTYGQDMFKLFLCNTDQSTMKFWMEDSELLINFRFIFHRRNKNDCVKRIWQLRKR